MITQQTLYRDADGSFHLRNTVDITGTLEEARALRENNPSGHFGDKNGEGILMGVIPEEMWNWHWLLKAARQANREGDKGKYLYYLQKFFEMYPAFKASRQQKYWLGSRVVDI